jgi:hypothetical protein
MPTLSIATRPTLEGRHIAAAFSALAFSTDATGACCCSRA